jgi:hypothetical protein
VTAPRIEDFYDVPPVEVILCGGQHDGKRIFVPDGRDTWLMPDPPQELSLAMTLAARGPQPLMRRCTVYRWTGGIRDDGLRVFRAEWHG